MLPYAAFVEQGRKKTFIGLVDFPGLCRWGKDESAALESLLAYAPRYQAAIGAALPDFSPPGSIDGIKIVERHHGTATTDFGGISAKLASDVEPVDKETLQRFLKVLQAGWAAIDQAAERAIGRELRTGPRGGGRDLTRIQAHVFEGERAYLRKIAGSFKLDPKASVQEEIPRLRLTLEETLIRAVREGLPTAGPRGGELWTPRYFVRHVTWHILDHAWEIEDRMI
jgi:hypothetical protein